MWTDEDRATCSNCRADVRRAIKVENSDSSDLDDGASVLLTVRGSGAAQWAKAKQQSILGSRWEADGDDFAYATVPDQHDLVQEIRDEVGADVEIDDGEYCPPDPAKE